MSVASACLGEILVVFCRCCTQGPSSLVHDSYLLPCWRHAIRYCLLRTEYVVRIFLKRTTSITDYNDFMNLAVVASLGYTGTDIQLMSVPPYACAFVCSLITSYLSDKTKARGPFAFFWSVIAVVGYAIWLATTHQKTLYGALVLQVTGIYATAGLFGAWNGEDGHLLSRGNLRLTAPYFSQQHLAFLQESHRYRFWVRQRHSYGI